VQATGIAANQVEISAVATDGTGGAGSPSGNGGTLPFRVAALVRQFSAVQRPVARSPYRGLRSAVTEVAPAMPAKGASVSLFSNGGINNAIGGATSGTLNLTQTANRGHKPSGRHRTCHCARAGRQ
jgi:hypothetical protein